VSCQADKERRGECSQLKTKRTSAEGGTGAWWVIRTAVECSAAPSRNAEFLEDLSLRISTRRFSRGKGGCVYLLALDLVGEERHERQRHEQRH
jgi:hypothetical protein